MSSKIESYRDLKAWQAAFALGTEIYLVTRGFPASERFGLTNQIRRSAVAIASNIAEGYGRGSRVDYLRFLKIARGSLFELETQLSFAAVLGYLEKSAIPQLREKTTTCGKLLAGLINKLQVDQR